MRAGDTMSDTKTKINSDEAPVFDGPISADMPRRAIDRRLLESIDADHRRSREHSNRLTRLESLYEQIARDLSKLEQQQRESLGWQEQTATSMAAISNKLAIRTELEEYQWTRANEASANIEKLQVSLSSHLQMSEGVSVRIDWLERSLYGIGGALASIALMVAGWLLTKV